MKQHHHISHSARQTWPRCPASVATLVRYWKQFIGLCIAVVAIAQAAPYLQGCLKAAIGYQDNTAEMKSMEVTLQNHLLMHAAQHGQEMEFQSEVLRQLNSIDVKLSLPYSAMPVTISAGTMLAGKPVN